LAAILPACKRTAEAVQPPIQSVPSVPSVVAPPPVEPPLPRDESAGFAQTYANVTGAFGFKLGEKCPAFLSRNIDGCLEADQLFQTNPPFSACFAYALDDGRVFRIWVSVDPPAADRAQVTASLKDTLTKKYAAPITIREPDLQFGAYRNAQWQFGSTNVVNLNVSAGYATLEYLSIPLKKLADEEKNARLNKAATGL
jgi:hypothetical protein